MAKRRGGGRGRSQAEDKPDRAGDVRVAPAPPAQEPPSSLSAPSPSPRRSPRDHLFILPVILACAVAFTWMVTWGTWRLIDRENFADFYDVQARSLLGGHWDVPFETLKFESFVRDGKYYAYFGFVPAVARMPLVKLFPGFDGHWSRASLLIGYVASLAVSYLILCRVRPASDDDEPKRGRGVRVAYAAFILSIGLGSTLIFLGARSFTYHEALMWGALFALACYHQLVRYLIEPRWTRLAWACAFALLAFFTRASVGGGAVLALLLLSANVAAARWLLPPHRRLGRTGAAPVLRPFARSLAWLNRWGDRVPPYRHAGVAAATVALAVGLYVGINYAKFRTYFDGTPLELYQEVLVNPKRLEGTNGKVLRAVNVRTGVYAYLSPTNLFVRPYFPWVMLTPPKAVQPFPEARYSQIEAQGSFTALSPALAVLAVLGFTAMRRRLSSDGDASSSSATIPLLAAVAGGCLMFAADGLTHRYLHDLFPAVVLAGALGLHRILALRDVALRRGAWIVLAPLILWGACVNFSATLMYQRLLVWGVPPDRQQQYMRWMQYVDEHISVPLFGRPDQRSR